MELWLHKIISIAVIFTIPFGLMTLPYVMHGILLKHGDRARKFLQLFVCFGGGIFLSTFMLQMSPGARRILSSSLTVPKSINYPVTDIVIGFGFFFILFLEQTVAFVAAWKRKLRKRRLEENCLIYQAHLRVMGDGLGKSTADVKEMDKLKVCEKCRAGNQCKGIGYEAISEETTIEDSPNIKPAELVRERTKMYRINNLSEKDPTELIRRSSELTELRTSDKESLIPNYSATGKVLPKNKQIIPGNESTDEESSFREAKDSFNNAHKQLGNNHKCGHSHFNSENEGHTQDEDQLHQLSHHNTRSVVLILALSIHYLFEGLSIGLQMTVSMLWTLIFAVLCHESAINFSLGLNFVKCSYSFRRHLVTALLVASIAPIGQSIGIAMSESSMQNNSLNVASGFLLAFSAGTFLYVTFFEIFLEEFSHSDSNISKSCCALLGFTVMAVLMLLQSH